MDTAAALVIEGIQRTVAEQTVEIFRIFNFVAGEILTFPVLKKLVAVHNLNPQPETFCSRIAFQCIYIIPEEPKKVNINSEKDDTLQGKAEKTGGDIIEILLPH